MKVKTLLSKPERWAKGRLARDRWGYSCCAYSKDAFSFCLQGAVAKCYPTVRGSSGALDKIRKILSAGVRGKKWGSITAFNDSLSTTFDDVKALLRRAKV